MELTTQISNRFRFVSLCSMIAVVFIHSKFIMSRWSKYIDTNLLIGKLSDIIQYSTSEIVCRLAVPLFFLISGYFMALHNDGCLETYKKKLKSRITSLLIPYLLFSLGWLIISVTMGKTQIESLTDFVYYLLIHPIPFQFWFLQHLMMLVLLSWGVICTIKHYGIVILPALGIGYILFGNGYDSFIGSFFFYYVGVYIALTDFHQKQTCKYVCFIAFIVLCIVDVVIRFYELDCYSLFFIVKNLTTLCGIGFVLWWILESNAQVNTSIVSSGASFFLFATHEPLLSLLKGFFLQKFTTQQEILIGYFVLPIITIGMCLAIYNILVKFNRNFVFILVGHRK